MLASRTIPLMVPEIRQEDIDAVVGVLRSGMLVQGKWVETLENNIADYLHAKHAIAVSNGTASLHLALIALGIGAGDEVIVPAFSYMATANVVEIVGAKPIFVDIKLDDFNIDVAQIEQAITPQTKAIIPVHEFGIACDISALVKLANKYKLKVIEDAACALGATENDKYVGTFGDVGSFSFHPRKNITSGEGGLLVTNDDQLAEKLRILRNHGIQMVDGKMDFVEAGYNYRMTDFQAAMVYSQFQRFDVILLKKRALAETYLQQLADCKVIKLPSYPKHKNHTWQSFHVMVQGNRDEIIQQLKQVGIGSNYGAQCMPYQTYYSAKYGYNCQELYPNALDAYLRGLVLPLYPSLSNDDVVYLMNKMDTIMGTSS
ncbi:MAG: DegT/DnrJ/EryC1/StrS aminotransferase family protein [Candidatus Cloacimonetes bacterium]|nr:DegT/DnrJ/EryC1/StrS aminotransferase family protein [Candidatus Cloacimonadota bacterium]